MVAARDANVRVLRMHSNSRAASRVWRRHASRVTCHASELHFCRRLSERQYVRSQTVRFVAEHLSTSHWTRGRRCRYSTPSGQPLRDSLGLIGLAVF